MFSWTLATRYLLGRKLRSALTTLAVVFGVLVLFGMNTLIPTFIQAFQANVLAAAGQIDLTVTQVSGEAFDAQTVARVGGLEGVRVVSGSLNRTVNLPADFYDQDPTTADTTLALALIGVEVDTIRLLRSYTLEEGRFLDAEDGEVAVISRSLAETLGLGLGDRLRLPTTAGVRELTVVGLRPTAPTLGNPEVLVTLATAQRLLNQPGRINTLEIGLTTIDEPARAAIQTAVEQTLGVGFRSGGLSAGTELFAGLRLGQAAMSAFGLLALLMGGFIIFNTFRTVVVERRRDLAMLRAVGASRRTIMGLLLVEGLVQGVIGTALGMVLGYGLAVLILQAVARVGRQFVNLYVSAPVIEPWLVVVAIATGVGLTVLAGLLPAWSASRVSPLEALRPAPARPAAHHPWGAWIGVGLIAVAVAGLVSGQVSLALAGCLLLLLGLFLLAPALVQPVARVFGALIRLLLARDGTGDLAEGNTSRQPSRAAITASATLIAIALIVTAGGMLSSVTTHFTDLLRRSLGSDYLLVPPSVAVWASNVGAAPDLAERLRALPEVAVVSTYRFGASAAPAPASGAASGDVPVSIVALDPIAFAATAELEIAAGPLDAVAQLDQAARVVILNGALATSLKAGVGDTLTLLTPSGTVDYRVIAIGNDYLDAKVQTAYISHARLAQDFGRTEDVFLQLNLRPGVDRAAADAGIRAIAGDYPQFRVVSGDDYLQENIRTLELAFTSLYVLYAVLIMPSLIALLNTLAIGVLERTREIGTVRAVGATRRQIGRIVLFEALLLAALGTGLGLLAGLYLSVVLVQAIGALGFQIAFVFPWAGLLAAVAAGLLVGALAALIPARQAARLDVVQALRYE
jgi:putative ABC transport system permease protein